MRGLDFSSWRSPLKNVNGSLLVTVLLVLQSGSVRAQEITDPAAGVQTASDSTAASDSTLFKPTTIVLRLDNVTSELREIWPEMNVDSDIEDISIRLSSHLLEVDSLDLMYESLPEFRLSLRDLDNINRIWERLDIQARDWGETLYSRLEDLEIKQDWVEKKRKAWERIQTTADPRDLQLVEERMSAFVLDVDSLDTTIRSRLGVLFGLSDSLSTSVKSIQRIGDLLNQRVVDTRVDLFVREGPILPLVFFRGDSDMAVGSQVLRSTGRDWQALVAYYESNPVRFVVPAISFIFFLIIALLIKRRSASWDGAQDSLQGIIQFASKPLATALLLSLILVALLFQKPPPVISDIVRLAAFVPLIRLLPGMMPTRFRLPFFIFIGLFAFYSLNVLVRIGSPLERLFVFISGGGLAILIGYYLYQHPGLKRLSKRFLWRGALRLLHLMFVVVALGVIADFLGYGALGEILVTITFKAIFSALAIFAAVQILEGAWFLLLGSTSARRLNAVRLYATLIFGRGVIVIRIFFVAWWLQNVLVLFGVFDSVATFMVDMIEQPFKVAALTIDIGSILAFIFTIWITILASKLIRFLLQTDVFPKFSMPRGMTSAILTLTNYAILVTGFVAAVTAAGIDFRSLAWLVGGLGIGIGFGLQGIVNNFLSGLILIFERPIRVGDTIEVASPGGQIMAVVRRIGIRASTIRTFEGAEVIMPNANLISNDVTNWTKTDQLRRIEILVGVEYGTDPELVIKLLTGLAKGYTELLNNPEPYTLFLGFGENSLDFSLRAWIGDFDKFLGVRSDLTLKVHRTLTDAGIRIPYPQRDIHLRTDNTKNGDVTDLSVDVQTKRDDDETTDSERAT